MKKWVILIALLFPATTAFANPVIVWTPLDGVTALIIYVSSFGAEVLLVATILYFCHMALKPLLITLFIGNIVMYFVVFQPVLSATGNVPISEAVIVIVEGAFIKMLSSLDVFQLEDFKGLKWITAMIIAAAGNALSYYSGVVIGG
jgi:multisubunit Na+/H+ antiporter MnhG subunit